MEDVTFTLQIKPPLSIDVHAATTTFNVRSTLLVCTTVSCTIKNGTIPIIQDINSYLMLINLG